MSIRVGGAVILDTVVAAPAALTGKGLVYVKSDGHVYARNAAGTEYRLSGNEVADSGWLAVTYANSWVDYAASGWATGAYRKIGNLVMMKGLIKSGSPVNSAICTLPLGYRPLAHQMFPGVVSVDTVTTSAPSAGTAHTHTSTRTQSSTRIDVANTGVVSTVASTINPTFLSLNNVMFTVD